MVDNFDLISKMFYFNEEDNMFFHCQIVQRAKDHEEKVKEGAIKTYFIRSKEHLQRLKEEIVLLCEHYGARAYINVAGKDFVKVQQALLAKLAQYNMDGTVRNPRKTLNSVVGNLKSKTPKWVIDIDDPRDKEEVLRWLDAVFGLNLRGNWAPREQVYLHAIVPTKTGEHLIVSPFNLAKFNQAFPDIDVHKNSMGTVLYVPKKKKSIE